MKIIIENTEKIVELNGIPARIWEGKTDSGISVHCFITRIACDKNADLTQFQKELNETKCPSEEIKSYPLSMIL